MRIINRLIDLFLGSFLAIILPTILLGGITWYVYENFGVWSIQLCLWFALVWWLSMNYIVMLLKNKK